MQVHRHHQGAHRNENRQHDEPEQQVAPRKLEPGEPIAGQRGRHRRQHHGDNHVGHRIQQQRPVIQQIQSQLEVIQREMHRNHVNRLIVNILLRLEGDRKLHQNRVNDNKHDPDDEQKPANRPKPIQRFIFHPVDSVMGGRVCGVPNRLHA
ncbi:hypothetical protein D3C73_1173980 [compost metagenome]